MINLNFDREMKLLKYTSHEYEQLGAKDFGINPKDFLYSVQGYRSGLLF